MALIFMVKQLNVILKLVKNTFEERYSSAAANNALSYSKKRCYVISFQQNIFTFAALAQVAKLADAPL